MPQFKSLLGILDKTIAPKAGRTIDKTLPNGGLMRIRVFQTAGVDKMSSIRSSRWR